MKNIQIVVFTLFLTFMSLNSLNGRPGGPGDGNYLQVQYWVTVTDPAGTLLSGIKINMIAFYSLYEYAGYWSYNSQQQTGYTGSDGRVKITMWIDITNYVPNNYLFDYVRVSIAEPEYTVLSSQNTTSNYPMAVGSFVVAADINGNNVFDYFEVPLAQKFAPIYEFHQNNPLFPMPVEAVYGENNPTILNNNDPNSYLPLPISNHNPSGWENYFLSVLKPKFDMGFYHPTVYFQIFKMNIQEYGGSSIPYYVIQYWVYYPYDDAANVHEGDFEHIDVIVTDQDPNVAQGVGAVYYQHNTSKSHSWNQLETVANHPVVYVGGFESVRLIAKPTKTRPGHEITGASFSSPGMHYSVDYPTKASEGLIMGIVTWRADENVIPNRELSYNDYFLVNMTLPQSLWWMGYPGHYGASPNTVRSTTNYEVIQYNLPFVSGEFDFPQFSEPPVSPPHKDDKWQKIDRLGSEVTSFVYGPVSIDGSTPLLAVKYTLLARTRIRFRYYTNLPQIIKDFGWVVKEKGTYIHLWNWKNNSGNTVGTSNYVLRINVEPENLLNYFWYYNTSGSSPD